MVHQQVFRTLPDHLATRLDLVLVGINPGQYSVERGHYFARPQSRFWPAFSRSRLSEHVRRVLGVDALLPEHDKILVKFGIGLTDIVKRPTNNAAELTVADFEGSVPRLVDRIRQYEPLVACFHGVTGYRSFARIAFGRLDQFVLGPQKEQLGATRLYIVPNPSPANAHFTVIEQAAWYDRVAEFVAAIK
jgi:double-stranded uracil-DNA glycosylase